MFRQRKLSPHGDTVAREPSPRTDAAAPILHLTLGTPDAEATALASAVLLAGTAQQRALIERAWPDPMRRAREVVARRKVMRDAPDADVAHWLAVYASRFFEDVPFQEFFTSRLLAEPGVRGRVLDIGCASFLAPAVYPVREAARALHGVDPDPGIEHHPHLDQRWHGNFEEVDLPEQSYDLAYSYNVLEHIVDARRFFARLRRVLKPGAPFLALTPHALHPFCLASLTVQSLRAKRWANRLRAEVNPYAAYYRMNSRRAVLRAIDGLGFTSPTFWYLHATGWSIYFPRALRWLPRAYDGLVARHFEATRLLLVFRLQAA